MARQISAHCIHAPRWRRLVEGRMSQELARRRQEVILSLVFEVRYQLDNSDFNSTELLTSPSQGTATPIVNTQRHTQT
jgi:hypothetical protein